MREPRFASSSATSNFIVIQWQCAKWYAVARKPWEYCEVKRAMTHLAENNFVDRKIIRERTLLNSYEGKRSSTNVEAPTLWVWHGRWKGPYELTDLDQFFPMQTGEFWMLDIRVWLTQRTYAAYCARNARYRECLKLVPEICGFAKNCVIAPSNK